jgi:hypothetical protein
VSTHCIEHTRVDIEHTRVDALRRTWCGRDVQAFEWTFLGVDHAACSIGEVCKACREAVKSMLDNGDSPVAKSWPLFPEGNL